MCLPLREQECKLINSTNRCASYDPVFLSALYCSTTLPDGTTVPPHCCAVNEYWDPAQGCRGLQPCNCSLSGYAGLLPPSLSSGRLLEYLGRLNKGSCWKIAGGSTYFCVHANIGGSSTKVWRFPRAVTNSGGATGGGE